MSELLSLVSGLVGVLVGVGLTIGFELWRRNKRVGLNLAATATEIAQNTEKAKTYYNDEPAAPGYRLNDRCFKTALPMFLADDGLEETEIDFLLEFYEHVRQLNASIDRIQRFSEEMAANTAIGQQTIAISESEGRRARLKASHFITNKEGVDGKVLLMLKRLPKSSKLGSKILAKLKR